MNREGRPAGLVLQGLDGANPLAFLAALGTLRTLSRFWPNQNVRMAWKLEGAAWRPALSRDGDLGEEQIVGPLLDYNGLLVSASTKKEAECFNMAALGDIIGVSPGEFDKFARRAFCYAKVHGASPAGKEPLDFVAAYGSSACLSDKGKIEPTQLSFANGQSGQSLLKSFRELRDGLTKEHLLAALYRPWTYTDPRPTLRWDPADCRPYAHLATDPGNSRTTPIRTMRGANYLAFLGLPLLPSVPAAQGIRTTGFTRSGRQWAWTWPTWECPLTVNGVGSLLALSDLQADTPDHIRLRRLGVAQVFRSRRFSYQKGIYFSPATCV